MDPVSQRVSMSLEAVDWSAWDLAAEVPAVGYANGRSLARICAIGPCVGNSKERATSPLRSSTRLADSRPTPNA
jgi:hypothetical protein